MDPEGRRKADRSARGVRRGEGSVELQGYPFLIFIVCESVSARLAVARRVDRNYVSVLSLSRKLHSRAVLQHSCNSCKEPAVDKRLVKLVWRRGDATAFLTLSAL